jgi:hypothetical protein
MIRFDTLKLMQAADEFESGSSNPVPIWSRWIMPFCIELLFALNPIAKLCEVFCIMYCVERETLTSKVSNCVRIFQQQQITPCECCSMPPAFAFASAAQSDLL